MISNEFLAALARGNGMEFHEEEEIPCTGKDDDPCATILGRCGTCGYVNHDIPQYADEAHAELCPLERDCGS